MSTRSAPRAAAVTIAVGLAVAVAGSARGAEPPDLVFSGITILDGVGGTRERASLIVRGGKIAGLDTAAALRDARRIDVKGAYLTPGFVDAASRAGYAGGDAESTREMTAEIDTADLVDPWSGALRRAAYAGTTAVLVVPGPDNVVGGLSQAYRTWTTAGGAQPIDGAPKAFHVSVSSDASRGNFSPRSGPTDSIYARRPTTRMGVVWMLRQTFLTARGLAGEQMDACLTCYDEVLSARRPCRVFARRWQDMTATLRVADEVGLRVAAFEGCDEAYLGREELARRGVPTIVGPFASLSSGEGPDYTDTALRNATLLRRAGVRVALTAGNLGGERLREQAILAVRYGLSRDEALAAVTSVPAELCGLTGRGRIAEGGVADVVLWSSHPLTPAARPLLVVVDGHVVLDETETGK